MGEAHSEQNFAAGWFSCPQAGQRLIAANVRCWRAARGVEDTGAVTAPPHHPALRDAAPAVFWLDDPAGPPPLPHLAGNTTCDLAVVGAGFTGLWCAYLAKQRQPSLDVVVVEARHTAAAASGRNGGFCDASLTHGFANGLSRFPAELTTLDRLGLENLDAIEATVRKQRISCDMERTGMLDVAVEPWQAEEVAEAAAVMRAHGYDVDALDAGAVRAQVRSPTYAGGLWIHGRTALLNPARLAWGLRRLCLEAGVRIHEGTAVTGVQDSGERVTLRTAHGELVAWRVALATNADRPLLVRLRPFVLPVYDYVLVTEPLTAAQLESVGWASRQGVGDSGNQFHYYRLTADSRILWGGIRRHLPLRQPRREPAGAAPPDLRQARRPLLHHVPAVGGGALHAPLGRRDRHLQPVLCLLGDQPRRAGRLCPGPHRARRWRLAVRRPGDA
jgi:glycine/D-amino acid oxidase-like deaminating enzyme